ncbi:dipeptidase [Brevibacterium zhoupengii]|uniref:dipeptidase n=1 Tax=Brevibacterium zhoupengii TaxID=2898795 RepID=UPI001F091A8F|nr:membrane dipeptidase [Brevibacterium zhoupengii]
MIIDAKVIPALQMQTLLPFQDAGVTTVNVPASLWHDYAGTRANLKSLSRLIESNDSALATVRSTEDITSCDRSGSLGIVTSISSSAAFDDDPDKIADLQSKGIRIAQPVFMARSAAGSSYTDNPETGLTDLGRKFVAEFNRLGIAIDLSHVGDRTAATITACSTDPVFFSQTTPRSLNPAKRNKTDKAMGAVANGGGVICIAALRQYLPRAGDSTVDDIADAIIYCVNTAGEEHVAIGSDLTPDQSSDFYRYVSTKYGSGAAIAHSSADDATPGFSDATGYCQLRTALQRKNMQNSTIDRIMGTNLFRYFNDVWK